MKNLNNKYLVSSGIVTALVIVAVVLFNLIASSLTTKFNLKLDLTKHNQYEISQETKEVMKSLDKDVRVMVMGNETEISPITNEYLQKYAAMSDKFNVEYIDVYKNQVVLNQYQAKGQTISTGDIILECGELYKIVKTSEVYDTTMSLEPGADSVSFALESKLTNGLVVVTGLAKETGIYFLEGHGETVLATIKNSIDSMGYKNDVLNLVTSEIPEDAGLLISIVPTADFTADEITKLSKFSDRGGNLFVVYSPGMEKLRNLDAMLLTWGIKPNYDLVLEKDTGKVLQYEVAMLTDTYGHEITDAIRNQSLPLVSYYTSSFEVQSSNVNNAEVTTILETTDLAIGKTNFESTVSDYEEGDKKGPLALSVVAERSSPKKSRLAVIGSAGTLQFAEQYEGNSELMSGFVSWLTNNSNGLRIAPKIISQGRVEVTNATLSVMNILLVWVIPVLILVIGIAIWIRRRYL